MKRSTFCAPLKKDIPWSLTWNSGLAELGPQPTTHTKTDLDTPAHSKIQSSAKLSPISSYSTSAVTTSNLGIMTQTQSTTTSTFTADYNAAISNIQSCKDNTTMVPGHVAARADAPVNPSSQTKTSQLSLLTKSNNPKRVKPPKKPVSNFMIFVSEKRGALTKKGISPEEATNKAVQMWRISSPAVKDKYQRKYEQLKAKYEKDIAKFNEKLQSKPKGKGRENLDFK